MRTCHPSHDYGPEHAAARAAGTYTGPEPKRQASPARLAANRQNALKSTHRRRPKTGGLGGTSVRTRHRAVQRGIEKNMRELESLQTRREAARKQALEEAAKLTQVAEFTGEEPPIGFVFRSPKLPAESTGTRR